jgi:hypothetical protein
MKSLMPMLRLTFVDIWVLDVEGAELLVLKGTDFKSFHANVIVMECDGNRNGEIDREKVSYLQQYDYDCHRVSILSSFTLLLLRPLLPLFLFLIAISSHH